MLTTLAEAKTFLGVTASTDDTVITALITAAGKQMEAYCGRHLESTNVTETLDGTGTEKLWLKEPAESITTVHEDSDQSWTASTLVASTDYLLRGDGCLLERLDSVWLEAQACIRVVYKAGYTTVPDVIETACWIQTAKLYSEWQAAKKGLNVLASHSVEGWAQTFLAREGIDPSIKDVLDSYKPARL